MTTTESATPEQPGNSEFAAWRRSVADRLPRYSQAVEDARDAPHVIELRLTSLLFAAVCADAQEVAQDVMARLYPLSQARPPLAVAPTASLATWCAARGLRHKIVTPPTIVEVPPFARHHETYRYVTEPAIYACIPGGEMCPGWDYPIGNDGTVIEDFSYLPIARANALHPHAYLSENRVVVFYAPERIVEHAGDAIFLSSPVEEHFGHWLLDFLPRLRARAFVPGARFAVPDTLTRKQFDVLALFGLGREDLILCDPGARHRFERLHVYRVGSTLTPNPDQVAFLRAGLFRGRDLSRPRKRLYLARGNIGTRLVANQAEVDRVFAEFGVVSIDIGELSVLEQQALMADAELIIGSFGTNLLATYMAPADCKLIVFAQRRDIDPVFPPTCYILGMDYEFLLCQSAGPSRNPRHDKDHDMLVDCAVLRESITNSPAGRAE